MNQFRNCVYIINATAYIGLMATLSTCKVKNRRDKPANQESNKHNASLRGYNKYVVRATVCARIKIL